MTEKNVNLLVLNENKNFIYLNVFWIIKTMHYQHLMMALLKQIYDVYLIMTERNESKLNVFN